MRALLLLVALLLPFSAAAEESKPGTLTVHGDAVTKTVPDQVTLPVTVREENADLKLAKEKHDDKLRKLLQLATEFGIEKDKVKTSYTSVSPQYDYVANSKPRLRGYEVQTSVDFTLTDISKLGRFMDAVIGLDISNVGSVYFSLQNEDKIKEDTLAKALENARAKAARLAATAQMALGSPLAIEEGGAEINRPFPPRPMMAFAKVGGVNSPPPELPSGLVEVNQSVTVTYSIK